MLITSLTDKRFKKLMKLLTITEGEFSPNTQLEAIGSFDLKLLKVLTYDDAKEQIDNVVEQVTGFLKEQNIMEYRLSPVYIILGNMEEMIQLRIFRIPSQIKVAKGIPSMGQAPGKPGGQLIEMPFTKKP